MIGEPCGQLYGNSATVDDIEHELKIGDRSRHALSRETRVMVSYPILETNDGATKKIRTRHRVVELTAPQVVYLMK